MEHVASVVKNAQTHSDLSDRKATFLLLLPAFPPNFRYHLGADWTVTFDVASFQLQGDFDED